MSIKDLFDKKPVLITSANSASADIESYDFLTSKVEKDNEFEPRIDFSTASNFAIYGLAEEYYKSAIERVYNFYPYDGSKKEKVLFELSSSYLDRWLYDNKYPKTNGYINFSFGGWGTQASTTDGFGLPDTLEYIYVRGGLHTASGGMAGKPLYKTFNKSVKYHTSSNRTTNLRMDVPSGMTVEFWLKKEEFDLTKTNKEIILDLWNGNLSSSVNYGRFTLALSGTTSGEDTFLVTLQSGSTGFYEETIGTSTITTSSLSSWHHYALSFVSAASGVTSRIYRDGELNEKKTLGTVGINEVGGLINGYIGALQTSPSGSSAEKYAGKLSGSLDELRYWKTRRTSKQISDNWNRALGSGTNTDDANTNLGIYYKFNEGVVGASSTDSIVLDYSGRIANGSWTGYQSGSRNTGSALVLSGLASSELLDPIIHSSHPSVVSLLTEMQASGSLHDVENGNSLIHKIPSWMVEEDEESTSNLKYLLQIIASYLDTLHAQVTELPKIKHNIYHSNDIKALPFAKNLIQERGFINPDIFINSEILEKFEDRDNNGVAYEQPIEQIKNLIYQNIYNNVDEIYKSKGTERSIRNVLRCFGVDDEIIRLNLYTDKGKHYFTDKVRHTSVHKKFIDFNKESVFGSTVFQTSSVNNSDTFISGSGGTRKERNSAFTFEINTLIPFKTPSNRDGYLRYAHVSSSIGGMHQATPTPSDYTWNSTNDANFQIYLVRDEIESQNAKFLLKNRDGSINLTSSYIDGIYDNELWTVTVRLKPEGWPFYGSYVSSSNPNYTLEFYGVHYNADYLENSFYATSSISYASGSSMLSNNKRIYVGAHLENFTGSVLEYSDVRIGTCRYYLDYLDDDTIKLHNRDITNHGSNKTYENSTMFGIDLTNKNVPAMDMLALNWDFTTVTGSDASGDFVTEDFSSGSTDSIYGWIDEVVRREHRGRGYGFPTSATSFVNNDYIFVTKKELPEISYSSDNIEIVDLEKQLFIEDLDTSDNLIALEKSMYQVISEQMLNKMSSTSEMNNLIGKAVDRYRLEYKNLRLARRLFFEDIEEDPDLDRFVEYFKWIDKSIFHFVQDLFPVSARVRVNDSISDMVESHIFERNKIPTKKPNKFVDVSPIAHVRAICELSYNWKFGHAPIPSDENTNCLWQLERKERTDIPDRETIRKSIVNDNGAPDYTLANADKTIYSGSTYALRRLSRVYKNSVNLIPTIHGGINYEIQKNREIALNATERHGSTTSIGIPKNVMVVGVGVGQGIELPTECKDIYNPSAKRKYNAQAFLGKFAGDPVTLPFNDSGSYSFGVKGARGLPFNIFSGTINSGYNTKFHSGVKENTYITNVHSDTTNHRNDVPMQGPFTQTWVGGHQSRHIPINKYDPTLNDDDVGGPPPNNLHNEYTRAEAWRIAIVEAGAGSDGAFGLIGSDYGGPYPDPSRKSAVLFREERAKRPVNISNILTTTGSDSLGNFMKNYEVVSVASGKINNNLEFRSLGDDQTNFLPQSLISTMPKTTHVKTLLSQSRDNDVRVITDELAEPNKTIITARFSSPGGFEVQTYGYLDAYAHELSVHNALPYRNLTVRGSGSGESDTVRLDDHLGKRHGLRTHLTRHSGKFGHDSVYGSVSSTGYVTSPSFHKIQRNISRRITSGSSLASPQFSSSYDNGFVSSMIPRSDYQYSWITSSLGSNYSINSGKQRMFGYSPRGGILSSSYSVHGEVGYVAALTFPTASEIFGE